MHSSIRIGDIDDTRIRRAVCGTGKLQGFALSLTAKDAARRQRLFDALSDGGQVQMPLDKTFFSPAFGMVADRFGVSWMVYVEH